MSTRAPTTDTQLKLFMCIGAAKSGTTWLYDIMRHHPALYFTPEKELHYFFSRHGTLNRLTRPKRYNRFCATLGHAQNWTHPRFRRHVNWYLRYLDDPVNLDWYKRLFKTAKPDQYWCDFSPSTSLIPAVGFKEIYNLAPSAKLVFLMRDPVDRLWSHIKFHMASIGRAEELERFSQQDYIAAVDDFHLAVRGDYGSQYHELRSVFPPEQIKVIFFDDIRRNPAEVLAKVETFLEIPSHDYSALHIQTERNRSATMARPEFMGLHYKDRFVRELDLLQQLGVKTPSHWNA